MALSEIPRNMDILSKIDHTLFRRNTVPAQPTPEATKVPLSTLSEQIQNDLLDISELKIQDEDFNLAGLPINFEVNGRDYNAYVVDGDSVIPSDIKWEEEVKRGDEIITVTHSLEFGADTLPLHIVTDPQRKEPIGESLVHGWLDFVAEPDLRDHTTGPAPLEHGVLSEVASDVRKYRNQLQLQQQAA